MAIHPPVEVAQDASTLARTYIHSLQGGYKPSLHPDAPEYEHLFQTLNHMYDKALGNTQSFTDGLERLARTDKQLAELLNITPVIETVKPTVESVPSDGMGFPMLPEKAQLPDDLMRGASPCMDEYVAYSKLVSPEGYEDFHPNSFLFLLSTIAARRIVIPLSKKQYTPLMIVFTARTTLYAKTETASAASDVLSACGLDWMLGADKTTPQMLMADMSGKYVPEEFSDLDYDAQQRIKNRLAMSGQLGWNYDEFGKFMKSMVRENGINTDFAEMLLFLDMCRPHYTYKTLKRGNETIQKPYLALLGTMTPSNIREIARTGSASWSDGFLARFSFVTPPRGTGLDIPFGLGVVPIPGRLISALQLWHQRLGMPDINIQPIMDLKKDVPTGRYEIEREDLPETAVVFGEGVFQAWVTYRSALKELVRTWHNEDLDGSYGRLPTKAIRVAALIASLENNNRIEMRHWALAQHIAERWRISLHELYAQVNSSESSSKHVEDEILRHMRRLAEQGTTEVTANLLSGSYMKSYGQKEIVDALRGMVSAGSVQTIKTSHAMKYKLTEAS